MPATCLISSDLRQAMGLIGLFIAMVAGCTPSAEHQSVPEDVPKSPPVTVQTAEARLATLHTDNRPGRHARRHTGKDRRHFTAVGRLGQ